MTRQITPENLATASITGTTEATTATGPSATPAEGTTRSTRAMLASGVAAGALFMTVALAQAFTRHGFDIRRHPLSLLSLGDLGWIQVTNFVLAGALSLAFALGVRRVLHPGPAGTWGPVLIAGFGLGMIIAGIFRNDPALGFPPGTRAGTPTVLSWHAWLHTAGFALSFTALPAANFVFARRLRTLGWRGWARYSTATGALTLALIALGMASLTIAGPAFAAAGALATWWIAAVAASPAADSTPRR